MNHILHDVSVFLWGIKTDHPYWRESRPAIVWPVTIRRAYPSIGTAYTIRFQRPQVFFLNAYELEASYIKNQRSITAK